MASRWIGALALFAAVTVHAQLTVYDDALQNGFVDYSYGGVPADFDFANTNPVHSGTKSIRFVGDNFNALAFAHPGGTFTTAQYPIFHFWIHGGTVGGQHVRIEIYNGGGPFVSNALIDTYIAGGSIAANVYREVTVNLTQAPLSYNGSFDRIDLQSDQAAVQPVLYIDDIALNPPAAPPPAGAIQYVHDITVQPAGLPSDKFTWQDSAGHPRVAVLAHNDTLGPHGAYGGALHEFDYQLGDGSTRIANATTYGNGGYGGFGYIVSHAGDFSHCVGDDSPLGFGTAGNWQRVFEGRHHAIFRFTQNYPRNCPVTQPANLAEQHRTIPVTFDWIFSTGRDNPVYAITWDIDLMSANPQPDTFDDDTRAPYGELNIDGDGGTAIDGVAWGDRYKFTSTGPTPVTLDSSWDWTQPNTVPYIKEWIAGARDATMGLVQTQTNPQQDAAGGREAVPSMTSFWTKTSATIAGGHACNKVGRVTSFPCADDWPYQALADSLDYEYDHLANPTKATNNARLTWKTQYGFIGKTAYPLLDNSGLTAPGYPKKSYSTYVVLGQHTNLPVEAQVAQILAIESVTLTAAVGTVRTQGPAGITRADNVTYQPAGYNHVYGALAFNAAGNQLDANIAVGAGTLKKPLIIVSNYTAGDPTVKIAGAAATADVDYFASLRPTASELWITLNRDLNGATNHIEINPAGAPPTVPGAPTIGAATPGNQQAIIAFTPPASNGGSPITGYTATCTPGPISANGGGTPITVLGLTNGTLYTCSVTANNVVGSSAPSGTVTVTPTAGVVKGDANGDGLVNVADVFYLINNLFAGGPGPVSGDANGDGVVNVADIFYLINFLFAGGPAPH